MFRPGFIFQISPQPNPADSGSTPVRLGIIASRKVGKAHERNLARRRLREIFRQYQSLLPSGIDLVLIIRSGIKKQSFEEIRQDYLRCVSKSQTA
jgi:ribonuclease P protein component